MNYRSRANHAAAVKAPVPVLSAHPRRVGLAIPGSMLDKGMARVELPELASIDPDAPTPVLWAKTKKAGLAEKKRMIASSKKRDSFKYGPAREKATKRARDLWSSTGLSAT